MLSRYEGHTTLYAMDKAIQILEDEYNVTKINLGHRKTNIVAGRLYEKLGFEIVGKDEQDYFRMKNCTSEKSTKAYF